MAHILRDEPPGAVFEYDGEVKALYYHLTHEPVSRTVSIGDRVNVDVDSAGQAVGVEILNPPGFTMTAGAGAATPCRPSAEGGLCDCDEPDEPPKVCLGRECDCV